MSGPPVGPNDPTQEVPARGAPAREAPAPAARTRAAFPKIPEVEIEDEIGRGGMGVVYRGRQPYLDRRVAIKLLLGAAAKEDREEWVERFRREAKILAGLSHPNIVACYQAGTTASGDCYLVMEFVDGPNLRDWIAKNGPLAEEDAVTVVRDVARALEHAHASGIIHRDVKPENVLLLRNEKAAAGARFPWTAKLVDLGLARPTMTEDATRLTAAGVVMGTPSTMAPEQFDAPEEVDFRADIYGLGCVLYHALTGQAAFPERALSQIMMRKATGEVPDPRRLRSDLRPEVAALVRDMLAARRENRPQSYEALIERCEAIFGTPAAPRSRGAAPRAAAASGPAERIEPAEGNGGARRRSRAALIAMAVVLVAVAGAAVVYRARPGGRDGVRAAARPPAGPLLGAAAGARLEGWERVGTSASWGPDEDGPGVIGVNRGHLFRPIRRPPWRVTGRMFAIQAREAGVAVATDGGGAVALLVQRLGTKYLVSTVRFRPDRAPGGGDFERGPTLESLSVDASEALPFVAATDGKTVTFEAGGKGLRAVLLEGAPTGFALYVNGPAVRFSDLVLERPEER